MSADGRRRSGRGGPGDGAHVEEERLSGLARSLVTLFDRSRDDTGRMPPGRDASGAAGRDPDAPGVAGRDPGGAGTPSRGPPEGARDEAAASGIELAEPGRGAPAPPLEDRGSPDWERGPARGGRTEAPGSGVEIEDPAAVARDLDGAVDEFLAASGSARERAAARIREFAAGLVAAERIEPVADVVLRLGMTSENDAIRPGGASLTWTLLTPRVAERLAARLEVVRDGSRRTILVRTLSRMGPVMARAAGDALIRAESRSARRALTDLLVALGDDAAETLGTMVADERWFVVRNAVLILGELGGTAAVEHLTGTLDHDDGRVRRETLMALARMGSPEAGPSATNLLDDPDERVRETAALVVGVLRHREAVDGLVRRVEAAESDEVLLAAIRALGRIGDPRATEVLERRAAGTGLSRASTAVRTAAYRALAALETARARAAVRVGLQDEDPEIRKVVKESLRKEERGGEGGAGADHPR